MDARQPIAVANPHQQASIDLLSSLYLTQEFSDLTLVCKKREFPVHRFILCNSSPVFAEQVRSGFQKPEGRITLDLYDVATVERMVHYIYKRDYHVPVLQSLSNDQSAIDNDSAVSSAVPPEDTGAISTVHDALLAHINVHDIGSHYQIPMLQTCAVEKFKDTVKKYGSVEYDWPLSKLYKVINRCYGLGESPDRGLRSAIICYVRKHVHRGSLEWQDFASSAQEEEVPIEFWIDMSSSLVAEMATTLADRDKLSTQYAEETRKSGAALQELEIIEKATSAEGRCRQCHARFTRYLKYLYYPDNPAILTRYHPLCGICNEAD